MIRCKKVYGLTGGISTGKSTVANILRDKNFKIVDSDKIAHQIMLKGSPAYEELLEKFGEGILEENGEIDREKLGDKVFGNRERLDELNNITHPHIMSTINEEISRILEREDRVFVDIPLLYEIEDKLDEYGLELDEVVLVYVSRETQVERLMLRDNIPKETAMNKIDSQMNIDDKLEKTDYVINNNGEESNLVREVEKVLEELEE